MIILILLGLLASSLSIANNLFWGIYIFAWVIKIIYLILSVIIFSLIFSSDEENENKNK